MIDLQFLTGIENVNEHTKKDNQFIINLWSLIVQPCVQSELQYISTAFSLSF